MVTINKVYTKTGDDGETSLGNFERVGNGKACFYR